MSNRPRKGNLEEHSEDEDTQQVVDPETETSENEDITNDVRHDYEEIENVNNHVVDEPSTSGMQKNKAKGNAKRKVSITEDRSTTTTSVSKNNKNKNDDVQEIIKKINNSTSKKSRRKSS
ncbi:unnamed protein product [Psylliodes chrysocephalus]|uniref:Uncharacterized protein n=1 Tax=Psylliodes chrysocephalus TaxID=3402493 RepID=A0A9P0CNG6_9CUCU|nr:unnamed protein product [Psylliodes chrysocephala]